MIDFNSVISAIRDNNGFEANEYDSSYYRVYTVPNQRPLQVRISNHGTHLWTWDEKAEYIPHRGYNISIVFMSSSKGYSGSNTAVNMDIFGKDANGDKIKVGTKPNFEVIQYVYDCDVLTPNNVARINQFIQQIPMFKKFIDPMKTNPQKHAKVYRLTPNNAPEIITENTNRNRKMNRNRIRLTESQLHNVIKESVKQILSELDWRTYSNYQAARLNQAKQAEQQGDFEAAKKYRMKAIQGGNAAGEALRKKYGYKDIDDFNQQQQAVRNNATGRYGNQSDIVKQRAQNYNQEASDYFSGKSQYVKGKGWVTKSDD